MNEKYIWSMNFPIESSETGELMALMLFPDDPIAQKRVSDSFNAPKAIEVLHDEVAFLDRIDRARRPVSGAMGGRHPSMFDGDEIFGRSDALRLVEESLRPSLNESDYHHIWEGILTGTQLIYYHILAKNDIRTRTGRRANSSKGVVEYVAKWHNLGRNRPGRGAHKCQYRTIDEKIAGSAWGQYCSVSHLWAAWINCRQSIQIPANSEFWLNVDDDEFIQQSFYYSHFVTNELIPASASDSFELISVPSANNQLSLPQEPKPCDELVQAVLKYAGEYKAKTKYLPA